MQKDYFEGCNGFQEIHNKEIVLEEKIHDCMPKYVKHDYFSPNFSVDMDGISKEIRLRDAFVQMGMFGFVSWKWINPFVEWIAGRKCLEVMAGRGWLSHALRQKGVDVIATDNHSWANKDFHYWQNLVTDVEELEAVESIEKYAADVDVVIMSWAFMDNTAAEVLKKLHEVNPNAILVYIGEGSGGCTADDEFYDNFVELEDESFHIVARNYERWDGIRDSIYIGKLIETK